MTKQIIKYLLSFFISICTLNYIIYFFFAKSLKPLIYEAKNVGELPEKFEYYKKNKEKYNVVYFGDSRTYTNINNLQIDTLLKTNSYNIAMWANWFPNQYAFLQDFLPTVPDGTTIIYSIGHQNFAYGEIQASYPISSKRAEEYYKWGFSVKDLRKPIDASQTLPSSNLFVCRDLLNLKISKGLQKYFAVFSNKKQSKNITSFQLKELVNQQEVNKLKQGVLNNSEVENIKEFKHGDTIASLEVFWKRGNYWRVELDSQYYRNKQKKDSISRCHLMGKSELVIDEKYWKNFISIIKILKNHQKRLHIIFNEFGEAPYIYTIKSKIVYNEIMNNQVKKYIQANEFTYIKVNVDDLSDSYYFDHDHLNNIGNTIYSARLANYLKTQLN